MPLPGETNVGRRHGSFSPQEEDLNNTPYKPVPLTFQQADGTLPQDENRNKGERNQTRRQAAASKARKTKIICAVMALIALLILLAIILSLVFCVGLQGYCGSSSSSSVSDSSSASSGKNDAVKGNWKHQVQLQANLSAPIVADGNGNSSFGQYLNRTLATNTTALLASSATTSAAPLTTEVLRRRRQAATTSGTTMSADGVTLPMVYRFPPVEQFVIDRISDPFLDAIRSSAFCQKVVCTHLEIVEFSLANDVLTSRFNLNVGSDDELSIDQALMKDTTDFTGQGFGREFTEAFPGFRLGDTNLAFDLVNFCNLTSVYCVDFPNIQDVEPPATTTIVQTSTTSTTSTTTTTTAAAVIVETTTLPDRSVLLPENETFFIGPAFSTDALTTSFPGSLPPTSRASQSSSTSSSSTSTIATTTRRKSVAGAGSQGGSMANCAKYGFICANMKDRIGTRERCDGIIQCPDGSDEHSCDVCRTSFSCPNGDGSWMCNRGAILCDGRETCPTGYDEGPVHCKTNCLATEYRCRNSSACIPKRWVCDGDTQCPQGDDEADCGFPTRCNNGGFFCQPDERCIPFWKVCDGAPDCTDGSDELRCSCVECSGNTRALCTAPYGMCILKKNVCDGKNDCPGGEDETNCK